MRLHVKCVEGKELPVVDNMGSCDGYLKLFMENQQYQTKIIDNSLSPKWRETFSFVVNRFSTDILLIKVYDHDKIGRDEQIGKLEINISTLPIGVPVDRWYTAKKGHYYPQLRLILHLARVEDPLFIQNPFSFYLCHIRIISGEIPNGKASIRLSLPNSREDKTSVVSDKKWLQEFEFVVFQPEEILTLSLDLNGKEYASKGFPLSQFPFNSTSVFKDFIELSSDSKIQISIHTSLPEVESFQDEEYETFPESTQLQLYIRVIKATSLKANSSNGLADPYVVLTRESIIKETFSKKISHQKQQTRIIKKTCDPIWRETFNFQIESLNEDYILFSVYDHSAIDTLIGTAILNYDKMKFGDIIRENLQLSDNPPGKISSLFIDYQLCPPGTIPFQKNNFSPYRLFIHVEDAVNLPTSGSKANNIKIQLQGDKGWKQTNSIFSSHPNWNQNLEFIA